jgi:hypothetical protein
MTEALTPAVTDWFQVITDLGRRGIPVQVVSLEINIPRTTILGWKQGSEPKHHDGERLILFWCQVTGKERESLPVVVAGDWRAYHSARR